MYKPENSVNINDLPQLPVRLGIQGLPGTGKTFAALTAPNIVYLDLDNKLKGFRGTNPTATFPVIPFWNRSFVEDTLKVKNTTGSKLGHPTDKNFPHNIRDAVKKWLNDEGPKLSPEQTLVLDSITSLNDGFDSQTQLPWEKVYNSKGEEDGFAFWKRKLAYNSEIALLLKNLPCNVIAIFHEQPERDENNRITGIKPLIQGQSADKMPGYFTDFYRQRVFTKDKDKLPPGCELTYEDGKFEIYAWQTCKDQFFQIACKSNPNIPGYVRADFSKVFFSS